MKYMTKIGSCLTVAMCGVSVAFGSSVFTGNIWAVSSSGYYSGTFGDCPDTYALDGDIGTYWLADTAYSSTVEYFLGVELVGSVRPKAYTLSESAGVAKVRRPKAFKLYAVADGAKEWIELDSRVGVEWGSAEESKTFEVDQTKMPDGAYYHAFKLVLIEPSGSSTYAFALAELDMDGARRLDMRDVGIFGTEPVKAQNDGSAFTAVQIVQRGSTVDPYDLFAVCQAEEGAVTNWFERSTCFTGHYAIRVSGLRLGTDYELCVGAKSASGDVSWSLPVLFRTNEDQRPNGDLPIGYVELAYLESTDGGCQYVDCGFAPNKSILGFDFDYIGYNAFVKGNTPWQGNRDTDLGVYLGSQAQGASPAVLISSSTGGSGTFPNGLFFYGGNPFQGKLSRNERTQITLSGEEYVTACGATANTISLTRGPITGPNVVVFAMGNGQGYEPNQFAVMRFYSLKIYEDSVSPRLLTHDFVPARCLADDVYGLFDLVENRWCPAGGKEPLLAGMQIQRKELSLGSLRYVGQKLSAEITRDGVEAVDVYAAWGANYGGLDANAWQSTAKCGMFAAGEKTAKFTTPKFGLDTVYVRFYTADGSWSETAYLPDQHHVNSGLAVIIR